MRLVVAAVALLVVWLVSARPAPRYGGNTKHSTAARSVLIVTSGRSGSTLVSSALGALPGTFSVLEPFYNYRDALPGDYAPPYSQMFDCSIFRNVSAALSILSPYMCNYSPSITRSHMLRRRCLLGKLGASDIAMLLDECEGSRARIVKTIRFDRFYDLSFDKSAAFPTVLFLTRNPWDVFKSQYALDWYGAYKEHMSTNTTHEMVLMAQEMCGKLNQTSTMLHYHSATTPFDINYLTFEFVVVSAECALI